MTEIPIIWKILILLILLLMLAIATFLSWRVLDLMKRVKQVQADRNKLLEERCSDILFRTIADGEKFIGELLSELEKKMILNALKMPEYKKAIEDPTTMHYVRKAYKNLTQKIKESFD